MTQKSIQINDATQGQIDDLVAWGHGPHFSAVVRTAIDRMWNAEREREIKMKTYMVCSKCGRTAEHPTYTRGWLIGKHKDPYRQACGEMVIRCPNCITEYAKRQIEK